MHQLPGAAGSALALLWINGTWPRKLAMLIGGLAASYYITPGLLSVYHWNEGMTGFGVGLCSMSLVDGIFRAWQSLALGLLLEDSIRKLLGLPPKGGI